MYAQSTIQLPVQQRRTPGSVERQRQKRVTTNGLYRYNTRLCDLTYMSIHVLFVVSYFLFLLGRTESRWIGQHQPKSRIKLQLYTKCMDRILPPYTTMKGWNYSRTTRQMQDRQCCKANHKVLARRNQCQTIGTIFGMNPTSQTLENLFPTDCADQSWKLLAMQVASTNIIRVASRSNAIPWSSDDRYHLANPTLSNLIAWTVATFFRELHPSNLAGKLHAWERRQRSHRTLCVGYRRRSHDVNTFELLASFADRKWKTRHVRRAAVSPLGSRDDKVCY